MRISKVHILLLLLLLAVACRGPRKISRDDMVDIMVQMLIQDQQLKQDPKLRSQYDTTLVYEGIFQAHGYDTDDFRYSLSYYLEDASRMEKIMGEVADILQRQSKEVGKQIELDRWRSRMLAIYQQKPDTLFPRFIRAVDTLQVRFEDDSIWFRKPLDSLAILPPQDTLKAVPDSTELSPQESPKAERKNPKVEGRILKDANKTPDFKRQAPAGKRRSGRNTRRK